MRNWIRILKKIFLFLVASGALWFVFSLAIYRIPAGKPATVFEGNVHFKLIELGLTNRDFFESAVYPNRYLVRIEGAPELYVSAAERRMLWHENVFSLKEKGFTVKAKIVAPSLLVAFG